MGSQFHIDRSIRCAQKYPWTHDTKFMVSWTQTHGFIYFSWLTFIKPMSIFMVMAHKYLFSFFKELNKRVSMFLCSSFMLANDCTLRYFVVSQHLLVCRIWRQQPVVVPDIFLALTSVYKRECVGTAKGLGNRTTMGNRTIALSIENAQKQVKNESMR